jgi:hypothetical protein
MRRVLHHAFEWLDRLILAAVKAMLLFAAIVAFLPLVLRTGLRHFSQHRHSGRLGG